MTWPPDETVQEAAKALVANRDDFEAEQGSYVVAVWDAWTVEEREALCRYVLNIPSLRRLAEENERLTQQCNAAADEVGGARSMWGEYQAEYLAREAAEQRVKELEQKLADRSQATVYERTAWKHDIGEHAGSPHPYMYCLRCEIEHPTGRLAAAEQRADAYREVAQQVLDGIEQLVKRDMPEDSDWHNAMGQLAKQNRATFDALEKEQG